MKSTRFIVVVVLIVRVKEKHRCHSVGAKGCQFSQFVSPAPNTIEIHFLFHAPRERQIGDVITDLNGFPANPGIVSFPAVCVSVFDLNCH